MKIVYNKSFLLIFSIKQPGERFFMIEIKVKNSFSSSLGVFRQVVAGRRRGKIFLVKIMKSGWGRTFSNKQDFWRSNENFKRWKPVQ